MVGESGGAMDAPHPFLLEDRELRLPVGEHLGDAGVLVLQRDELGLPLDPRALEAAASCLAAMSFLMWTIAASSGPASSSRSSTPARLAIICSNLLLRRSISCCFFSISVWCRRLSASYLATRASCSLISSFTCFTCTSSCVLFAVTFKVSTRTRASSFCICAPIASFSITCCRYGGCGV